MKTSRTLEYSRREVIACATGAIAVGAVFPGNAFATLVAPESRQPWRLTAAGDAAASGLLRQRLELSYRRLQEPYYQWPHLSTVNIEEFPGDALGRAINGLSFLGQSLRTPPADNLQEIITRSPKLRNTDGYLGRVLPADRADEDSVAGHNGLLCGLVEYYRWTGDKQVLGWLREIRDELFIPLQRSVAYYREGSQQSAVQWRLSTFDIGQLFLTLDGLTRAYQVVPSPAFKATINAMIDRYRSLDMVKISAQTHSMLSATRGIVRWYAQHGRAADLELAETRFDLYKRFALTETYENYNWFNRPSHSEGCALVDSFELAIDLWSVTGKPSYLEDAHLILYNALLPGQCLNGGFGVGKCVGARGEDGRVMVSSPTHSEAPYCCSMRGAEGLVYAVRASHFVQGDAVALPFLNSVRSTLRFDDGVCEVDQHSEYPHSGLLKMNVVTSTARGIKRMRFFIPSWVVRDSVVVKVGGEIRQAAFDGAFAEIPVRLAAGTQVELSFRQTESQFGLVEHDRSPGFERFRRGALLLGLAGSDSPSVAHSDTERRGEYAVALRPILDVLDPVLGQEETVQVLFPVPGEEGTRARSQQPSPVPGNGDFGRDIAAMAISSYRRSPDDTRGRGLFSALKERGSVLDAFVWERAQPVVQVVIEWHQGATIPAPADVVLRWMPAGAEAASHRSPADVDKGLREKQGPGVIGDGRRWIFTLDRELGAGYIDNVAIVNVGTDAVGSGALQRILVLTR